jgi:WhiB family transcriptional regulator, redox-sensing transcriptional regulator
MMAAVSAAKTSGWHDLVNCLGIDPELFFPESGARALAAKSVCAGCVVRIECREHALESDERFGIWGGLSAGQRRQLLRRRMEVRPCPV